MDDAKQTIADLTRDNCDLRTRLLAAKDKIAVATMRLNALERRLDNYREENIALKRVGSTSLTASDLDAIREWYQARKELDSKV